MLLRLREFGATYGKDLHQDTLADEAFRIIENAVSQLDGYAMQRAALQKRNARARAVARAELVAKMDLISRTARVLQDLDPHFENTFLLPVRKSAVAVLTSARVFARDLEPHTAKFKAHGFADTFPADFKQLVQRYEQAVNTREAGKGDTALTRARIEEAITAALAAARQLDIIVVNLLSSVVEEQWRRIRRVGYRVPKETPATIVKPPVGPVVKAPKSAPADDPGIDSAGQLVAAEVTMPVDLGVGDTSQPSEPSSAAASNAAEGEQDEAA
jgi:hypothetical protein